MKKILLNDTVSRMIYGEYQLNPTEKYVISIKEELKFQNALISLFQTIGPPPAIKNYHSWLYKNNFNVDIPNPTNDFVAPYYGIAPLWLTEYSQGIVVKAEGEDDYYIVMECSSKNKGYKHTKVILTMGGCM